jgi:hypothetical protein
MRAVVVVAGLLVLLGVGIPSRAQDGPPPVETMVAYYEDERPRSLGVMLYRWNVCFERFVTLNPDLAFDSIPYGTRVLLPKDEPCYDYTAHSLPAGGRPRLKYYEDGGWLAEPYYTEEVVYSGFYDIDGIMRGFGICRDELLKENYSLTRYGDRYLQLRFASSDIFIPQNKTPCNDNTSSDRLTIQRRASEFLPLDLVEEFNVCPEEVPVFWFALYDLSLDDEVEFSIPQSAPPCYNEAGQRLIYFDDNGRPLDEPEYSNLQVYRLQPGETLPAIAEKYSVCFIDLVRLNYFPEWPISQGEIELFIPETRPCLDNFSYRGLPDRSTYAEGLSVTLNICYENLVTFNPYLSWSLYPTVGQQIRHPTYRRRGETPSLFVPEYAEPCYWTYKPALGESIYEIERTLNICHEAFIRMPSESGRLIRSEDVVIHIRRDVRPCYDDQGRRLRYEPTFNKFYWEGIYNSVTYKAHLKQSPIYSDMQLHIFGRADTVYSVSQEYNVCVRDLLTVNPPLLSVTPEGYPTFIPDTRPCYDEAMGMPLIYEDENGVPLEKPRVGDKLIYYGTEPFGHVSYYYNVCQNRIEDANAAKLAGEAHYLGWIIPHDRPPCYDEDGYPIDVAMQRHMANGGIVHTVQVAETLSEIAERYEKSIYWIADANNLSSVDMIWTDQKLIIPGGVTTRDVKLISAALIGLAAVGAIVMWRRR